MKKRRKGKSRAREAMKRQLASLFREVGLQKKAAKKQIRKAVKKLRRQALEGLGYVNAMEQHPDGTAKSGTGWLTDTGERMSRRSKLWGVMGMAAMKRAVPFPVKDSPRKHLKSTEEMEAFNYRKRGYGRAIWYEFRKDGWYDRRAKKYVSEGSMRRAIGTHRYWERVNGLRRVLDIDLRQAKLLHKALAKIRSDELAGVQADIPKWMQAIVRELITHISQRKLAGFKRAKSKYAKKYAKRKRRENKRRYGVVSLPTTAAQKEKERLRGRRRRLEARGKPQLQEGETIRIATQLGLGKHEKMRKKTRSQIRKALQPTRRKRGR